MDLYYKSLLYGFNIWKAHTANYNPTNKDDDQ